MILYSFRRCPYAIRARLALLQSDIRVEIREVKLAQKPAEFIQCSAKATVPVLVKDNAQVLDESLDIMYWALSQNDPENWLDGEVQDLTVSLIAENDLSFKEHLDHYKYAQRFPQHEQIVYRQQAEVFLQKLEDLLQKNRYLLTDNITLLDMAIMPFIRQFAGVEPGWFASSDYSRLKEWLEELVSQELFRQVMTKYVFWKAGDEVVYFPSSNVSEI
mgnify:CR=1 FL=1